MMEWDEFTRFVVVKAQLHHAQMNIDQLAEYRQGSRQVRKYLSKAVRVTKRSQGGTCCLRRALQLPKQSFDPRFRCGTLVAPGFGQHGDCPTYKMLSFVSHEQSKYAGLSDAVRT